MRVRPLILFVVGVLCSCTFSPDNRTLAYSRLNGVRQLVEQGKFNQAKKELDSIHILFPQEVAVRREAQKVSDSIFCLEAYRNMQYADSVKNVLQPKYDALASHFVHRVNIEYPDQSYFIHRTITYTADDQTHISATIYDNSEVLLRSVWVGNDLNHTGLIFKVNDLQQSVQGSLHVTQDLARRRNSVKIEVLTIDGVQSMSALQFVDLNRSNTIRVVLSGESTASYTLNSNTIEALSDTYQFAILLRDMLTAEQQIKRSKAIVERYSEKKE